MKLRFLFLIFASLCAGTGSSYASEKVGEFKFNEILMRPRFSVQEGQKTEFDFKQSLLSFAWQRNQNISAIVTLGSLQLTNQPAYYFNEQVEELGLVEAYGEYSGTYGTLRMGMLPVEFGVDGSYRETEMIFERSLLIQNRMTPLRDIGLYFHTGHNGYYTQLTIHNGEGGSDLDDRVWFTAKWGWENQQNLNLGWAAQTGSTKPVSTSSSTNLVGGVDNNEEADWRYGGIFAHWFPNNWDFLLEAYLGSVIQNEEEGRRFYTGHVDLSYDFPESSWSVHLRHDQFDPNNKLDGDLQTQTSLGLAYSNLDKTSTVYLLATKKEEESVDVINDQLQLVWRLQPYAN